MDPIDYQDRNLSVFLVLSEKDMAFYQPGADQLVLISSYKQNVVSRLYDT